MEKILIFALIFSSINALNAVLWPCESNNDCTVAESLCSPSINQCECEAFNLVFSDDFSQCLKASLFGDKCEDTSQCNLMPSGANCNSGVCDCVGGRTYVRGQCRPLNGLNQPCRTDLDCYFGYDRESVTCQNEICACANGYYQRGSNICRRSATKISDTCVVDADCAQLGSAVKCISYTCQNTDDKETIIDDGSFFAANGRPETIPSTNANNIQAYREIAVQTSIDTLDLKPLKSNLQVRHIGTITTLNSSNNKKASFLRQQRQAYRYEDEEKTISTLSNTDDDVGDLKYGSPCTENGKECPDLPHSVCSTNICLCKLGYYGKNDKCFAELGEIAETADECEFQFDDTSKKCLCQKNYFYERSLRQCRKPIQFNLSCTSDSQCSPFGEAFCHPEIPRRCNCKLYAEYNATQQMCTFKQGLGGQCDSDDACTVTNSQCLNNQCVCKENYIEKGDICIAGVGANCTKDEDCAADNTICEESSLGQDRSCQCRKGFVHFKDECYKEAEKLNDDCIESEQCQPLLATCIDKKCACTAEQHFKYGRCEQKKEIGEACSRSGQCFIEKGEENIECRNSVCQCKIEYQPDSERKSCIRVLPNKKNSSGRPSALKIITFLLIGSAFLITSAAIKQAYY